MRRRPDSGPAAAGAALALALALVSAAGAADLPASPTDYLAAMDANGDGRIDLGEYRDWMSRGFRRMDLDGNGVLEAGELPVPGARAVTWSNHQSALAAAFGRQDGNGDGVLDAAELAAPPR
jgi:Ca2+-binding EF-hand superfamily protein